MENDNSQGFKLVVSMADKPMRRISLKEKLEAFKAQAAGAGKPEIGKATDQDAQYDDMAKCLLGNKIILAHILVKTVDEFRGMNPKDVVSYIEGEPFISVVPVEPGLTNTWTRTVWIMCI